MRAARPQPARVRGHHHPERTEEDRAEGGAARGAGRGGRPGRGVRRLQAELRARFLLGRSYEDWAEFDEAETWFRSAIDRANAVGVPFAPYAFESRVQLTWIQMVRGGWDEVIELTDVRRESPPPIPRAILDSLRMTVEQGRGADVGQAARKLRRFWAREGAVAIHSAALEMVQAGRAGDPAAAIQVYDDVVVVLGGIWHEWFSARIRFGAVAVGAVAEAMPPSRRPSARVRRAGGADQRGRAHRPGALLRPVRPLGAGGPGVDEAPGRGDAAGALAGRHRRRRRTTCWSTPGARRSILFADFDNVHELARVRTILAGILRATGDTAGAREQGDLAREAAHRLGAQPLLDELRSIGSDAGARRDGVRLPHPARDRDPPAGRRRPVQRRDRQAALHQREDGLRARLQHPGQARGVGSHRGRGDRAASGSARLDATAPGRHRRAALVRVQEPTGWVRTDMVSQRLVAESAPQQTGEHHPTQEDA